MNEGNRTDQPELVALADSDVVARALFPPEWDERVQRGSPGCFKRNNTSVTRHTSLSFEQVVRYLKGDVEKPGSSVIVRAVGTVSIAEIKRLGLAYATKIHFQAWEKPTEKNPAHAELYPYLEATLKTHRKDVPRGLSSLISKALDITLLTPAGEVEGRSPPVLD
ncbi:MULTISPECIES: hypothetical protein [Stutzerimonas]|uniref:hypothetical protein n=1 Tax=Stutzerimonas TaxID=2901164 RepID=UPI0012E1855B|nr:MULTISPECIES: hypothetical protein [Stutzerimonas]MUT70819.1 hypothetical protein [Stutzerimonas frequens]